MPSSTAKRESLIPGVYLVYIAILLAVAFYLLRPTPEDLKFNSPDADVAPTANVDELDLAYLKARSATGELAQDELRNVVYAMIRQQRWQEAKLLLMQRPDVQLEPQDQFIIELETVAAQYASTTNRTTRAGYKRALYSRLNTLVTDSTLQRTDALERAATLSKGVENPELTAALYMLLADKAPDNSGHWFEQCADTLAVHQMHAPAVSCFRSAINASNDDDQRYDLSIRMLQHLAAVQDSDAISAELQRIASNLPNERDKLEEIANLALANQRADLAYPLYARLAELDPDNARNWYQQAAKWSEASSLPGLSAEYVLTLANLSDGSEKERLMQRRQKLLIASGRNADAVQTMRERLQADPDNKKLLMQAITLAEQTGFQTDAATWNLQLLTANPYDATAMDRQISLALASQDLNEARYWGQKVIAVTPDNRKRREQLARIEEWSGHPDEALPHWNWLVKNDPTVENLEQKIRLAKATWHLRMAADAQRQLAKYKRPADEDIFTMVSLYEDVGDPAQAAQALGEIGNRYGNTLTVQRELAMLHTRQFAYREALQSWEQLADEFGPSAEEALNRMELHWRLHEPDEASQQAKKATRYGSAEASDYQIKLLSELGWRYRQPEIITAIRPIIETLDGNESERSLNGRRVIQALRESGQIEEALREAEDYWRETGQINFLDQAMRLVFNHNLYPHTERYLDARDELSVLRDMPSYWPAVASLYVSLGDIPAAENAFEKSLDTHPDNIESMVGLLWILINSDDHHRIQNFLTRNHPIAEQEPHLWTPYAMANMKVGNAQESLRWFSALMERNEHDYNVLLTFAEALDQTGKASHAFKVRNYALRKLRPLVAAQTADQIDDLVRSYVSLLTAHGHVAEFERWTQHLLAGADNRTLTAEERSWREEMAISWYLSTQRHDYAKLLMARTHENRLTTPLWQELSVALHQEDTAQIKEVLASGKLISKGDQLIALGKVGREKEAYALSQELMNNGANIAERQLARSQYAALRNYRPSYYALGVERKEISGLDITEAGLSLRHTPGFGDVGFGVQYSQNQLITNNYQLGENDIENDVAVSAYFGNSKQGGSVTTGVVSTADLDKPYLRGSYYRSNKRGTRFFNSEVAVDTPSDGAEELRIAGVQSHAKVSYEAKFGPLEYMRVGGRVNEISGREDGDRVSTGYGASLELGLKGTFGSNSWSMGVLATGLHNTRELALPAELQLSPSLDIAALLAEESQRLAISGSLQRGGIRSNYPQSGSPRYHLKASLGHSWPFDTVGLQVEAGAGFRVLGDDELSLQLLHDTQTGLADERRNSSSRIGIQYRSHF